MGASRVFVKRIKLTGNTVFSEEELAPVVTPYEGRA
jgi:hemolysin activation/secretion protein